MLEQSFDVLSEEEQDADLAAVAAQLGRLRFFAGRPETAAEPIELALDIAESLRLTEVFVQALITKSLLLGSRGRSDEGYALASHALQVALDNDSTWRAARLQQPRRRRGRVDRYRESYEHARAGQELARRTGIRLRAQRPGGGGRRAQPARRVAAGCGRGRRATAARGHRRHAGYQARVDVRRSPCSSSAASSTLQRRLSYPKPRLRRTCSRACSP